MKLKTVLFVTLWSMLIPIAFYGATFVTLWLDNTVDEPLCSLASVIAITVTLAPVIMGFLADAQKTREKNFKLAFTMLAMIVLVFNIGGLLFVELTTLPKPFCIYARTVTITQKKILRSRRIFLFFLSPIKENIISKPAKTNLILH
jgi:hypothetical protein